MSNYTFKIYPDPLPPSNNKVVSDEPRPLYLAERSPIEKEADSIMPPLPFEQPPFAGPPYGQLPLFGAIPPFSSLPPFEQLPPFESIGPLLPNSPYQTPFNLPMPDPVIPVLPGYKVNPVLGHAYVLWQFYGAAYNSDEALKKGTMFPELFMPQGKYGPCEGPEPCRMGSSCCPRGGASCVDE